MKTDKSKTKISNQLTKSSNQFPVVGIGASAGGLDAFKKLLKAIPANSGMAYVLVQHLDPSHESMLAELLQKVTNIPVLEISDDIKVQPNHIYILPSNKMMVANDGVLLLSPRTTYKNEPNLPVDLFFSSLAEVHQSHSIGVVLSGTGSDGTKGLKAIKEQGGITFAQSEETAAFDGMPQSAILAGLVDFILAPELIPQKLLEITKITSRSAAEEDDVQPQDDDWFKQMLALLRIRKGTDFTYYKQTTIRRRILRRMALNKNEEPGAYLNFLRENKQEQDVLYQDLLIPVTSFFRDINSFTHLTETIFPQIIKNKKDGDTIRLWIAGCSTGQEVYSIAICLKELLGNRVENTQLFATDISELAIVKARTGVYTKSELENITPQRLQEFFTQTNGGYLVNKSIRDMCVFAAHNFLKDPPFGKLDLISCRNVLIYMEPYLQKKALTIFHYALKNNGFLLLGKSESISSVPELFEPAHKGDKIFSRKNVPGRYMLTATTRSEQGMADVTVNDKRENTRPDFQKMADDIMLSKYTPAGVVVNEAMDIVHFRGKTGNYLEQTDGKPSHNLLKMAKNSLAFELRNILHKAKKEKTSVTKENIPVKANDGLRNITIEAILLPDTIEPHYMILFHEDLRRETSDLQGKISNVNGEIKNKKNSNLASDEISSLKSQVSILEKELSQLREDMRSITEDQEAANEELQSANEELLSSSEELQTLNEELETGKEELQSTNEELTVVNQELIGLNDQITEARNYAETVIATLREPMLVLDKNQRIITANKSFYKAFRVTEKDTEGKLIYQLGDQQWNIVELRTLLENILPNRQSFTDFEVSFNFPDIGQRTMLLNASEIIREKGAEKSVLLSFGDITERQQHQQKENELLNKFKNLATQAPVAIVILKGSHFEVEFANEYYLQLVDKEKDFVGKPLFQSIPELQWQGIKELLDTVMQSGTTYYGNELEVQMYRNNKSQQGFYNFVFEPIREEGIISGIMVVGTEVTEQVLSRKKIEASERRYHNMIYTSPSLIAIFKGPDMTIEIANDAILESWGKGNDIVGKSLFEVMPEIIEQGYKKQLMDVFTTGEPVYSYETPITLFKNGKPEILHYTFVYQAQRDINGKIEGVAVLANEVTPQVEAKKKLIESEVRYRSLVSAAPVAIAVLRGRELILETPNQAYLDMAGKDESVIGKPVATVMSAMAKQSYLQLLDDVFTSGRPYQNFAAPGIVMKDGAATDGFYDVSFTPLFDADEKVYAILNIALNVTEQLLSLKKIEESEERFRTLSDQSPMFVFLVEPNAEATMSYFNKTWLDYTGQNFEEALGRAWEGIVHPDDLQQIMDIYISAFKNREAYSLPEIRLKRHDDQYRSHYFKGNPRYLANGDFNGYVGVGFDIHERKLAEEALKQSEKHFRQMADLMPAKISNANVNGEVVYFNKQWLAFSGFSFEELKAFGYQKMMHPDELEEFQSRFKKATETGTVLEMEMRFLNKDGHYKWHLNLAAPVKDENHKIKMWVGVTTEMQHQKEQREVLEKAVTERTYELQTANEHLEEKNEELQKLNKELESFAYVSSHDLQEPLRKIQTFASRIIENEYAALSNKSKDYFQRIQDSARRMQTLIEDLLTYSQTSNNAPRFEETDLSKIVDEVKNDLSEAILEKKATIEIIGGCNANLNASQFKQMMHNLIGNSLKFASPERPPHIIIRTEMVEGNQAENQKLSSGKQYCHLSVADNGIGFDPQYKDQIFEVFQRLHGKNEYPGTGIGLAIAKKVVENHNGVITANSEFGKGAIFDIYIPA